MDDNRNHIIQFIKDKNLKIGAEIGVWTGFFSDRLLNETNIEELNLIDPWLFSTELRCSSLPTRSYGKGPTIENIKSQKDLDLIYKNIKDRYENNKKVKIYREKSEDLANKFSDNYFDFIYIDGDHSFDGVLKDLTLYKPKVNSGRFIIGDDYNFIIGGHFSVKEAVAHFIKTNQNCSLIEVKNGQFIIQKG